MAHGIGLKVGPGNADLDDEYVRQLRLWLDESSLAAVVLLALDDVYLEDGTPRPDLSRVYVPNEYLFKVARQDHRLLPGISIHPARKDALELLEAGVEEGAVLLKLLPCVQIVDPALSSYRPFWKRMAELRLPLLAHTGGEFSLPTYRPDLCDPICLRPVLEQGVTVIAAHCGAPALPWARDFFRDFLQLRNSFRNLYGDIAALSQPAHFRTLARLREDPERVLLGSDYPVVTTAFWSRAAGWISAQEAKRLGSIRNPLERKLELTRAMRFPESVFTAAYDVLRPTAALAQARTAGADDVELR